MKTLVTLCFLVLLGLVVAQKGRGPCGCRPVFDFCANDYTTYHSICEYKCRHPSIQFEDWFILHQGPCSGQDFTGRPPNIYISDEDPLTTKKPTDPPTTKKPTDYKWEPRTGSSYKVHPAAETWYDARYECNKEGGYLAIINSRTESTILKDMFNSYTFEMITGTGHWLKYYASIGFRKLRGRWTTIQGESLDEAGFDEWSPGEPNNRNGDEDCGSIYWNGLLNDSPCESRFAYICEYTP